MNGRRPPTLEYATPRPDRLAAAWREFRDGIAALILGTAVVSAVSFVTVVIVHICFEWWVASGSSR